MTRRLHALAVAAAMLAAASAHAQEAAEAEADAPADETVEAAEEPAAPTRPGAEEGQFTTADSLSECAGLLAASAKKSTSFVERDNLVAASGLWAAAAAEAASGETGGDVTAMVTRKTSDWAGKVGDLNALGAHSDWLAYCASLGKEYGLDLEALSARMPKG